MARIILAIALLAACAISAIITWGILFAFLG